MGLRISTLHLGTEYKTESRVHKECQLGDGLPFAMDSGTVRNSFPSHIFEVH